MYIDSSTVELRLPADHVGIVDSPLIVADGTPQVAVKHLHTAFEVKGVVRVSATGVHQSHLYVII